MNSDKVAFVDIDGTLIKGYSQILFMDHLKKKKYIKNMTLLRIFIWTICDKVFDKGSSKKFQEPIYKEIVENINANEMDNILKEFNSTLEGHYFLGADAFIQSLKADFDEVILISSTPDSLAKLVANHFGILKVFATKLEIDPSSMRHTGQVAGSVMSGFEKSKIVNMYKLQGKTCYCYTDSVSDIDFLEAAHIKIAVNPKRKLRRLAERSGWQIIHL